MGKKSSTTNVQTGLGDKQYETITSNQSNIATSIDNNAAAATQGINEIKTGQETITQNQQTLADGQGELSKGQGTIIGNQDALKTGQSNLASGQQQILSAVSSAPSVDLSGVESKISALDSTTQTGFNNMTGRFDSVDSQLGTINEGVTGLGSQMTGVVDSVETLGTDMGQGFDAAMADREAMSELLATGQASMTDLINKYGESAATYYADLAGNQDTMLEGQAGLQQGLTAFQDDYNQNTEILGRKVGDIQDQVTGGFDAVRQGQSDMAQSVAGMQTAQAAAPAVSGISQNQNTLEIDYARIAKEVATGVDRQTDQGFEDGQMFASKLDNIRQILNTQGDRMDQNLRQQYTQLSNSFDANGRLISKQVDQNGNTIARAIDESGNLLLAAFDQSGQRVGQGQLDMNQLLAAFDALAGQQQQYFQMGGNYGMGNLSPARNRGASRSGRGLMGFYR